MVFFGDETLKLLGFYILRWGEVVVCAVDNVVRLRGRGLSQRFVVRKN